MDGLGNGVVGEGGFRPLLAIFESDVTLSVETVIEGIFITSVIAWLAVIFPLPLLLVLLSLCMYLGVMRVVSTLPNQSSKGPLALENGLVSLTPQGAQSVW